MRNEPGVTEHALDPGITIGSFQDCHHVASGLASEVYKSNAVALKVITETHNIEPHNPDREVKMLRQLSHENVIELSETFRDQEGRLVMVFPFMPLTFAKLVDSGSLSTGTTKKCFHDLFSALAYLHGQGIIHRDVKPSNLLLASPSGPACLSDFGTAWHPNLSADEPASHKCLEVGTTCYRAPETLFGNRSYSTKLDIWAAGAMLAECVRQPPKTLFESRNTSEDGNQLGLILSIFKTLGTPTEKTWPEAKSFTTPPFEWYQEFPGVSWDELLVDVDDDPKDLVKKLMLYESGLRVTAREVWNLARTQAQPFETVANIILGFKPSVLHGDKEKLNFNLRKRTARLVRVNLVLVRLISGDVYKMWWMPQVSVISVPSYIFSHVLRFRRSGHYYPLSGCLWRLRNLEKPISCQQRLLLAPELQTPTLNFDDNSINYTNDRGAAASSLACILAHKGFGPTK